MKWYDFIAILGLFILGFGIYQTFYLQYNYAWYYDIFAEVYDIPPYESQFLFNLYFTGIILTTIGIGLNIGLDRLMNYTRKRISEDPINKSET